MPSCAIQIKASAALFKITGDHNCVGNLMLRVYPLAEVQPGSCFQPPLPPTPKFETFFGTPRAKNVATKLTRQRYKSLPTKRR